MANGNYVPFSGRPGPVAPPLPTHAHPSSPMSGDGSPEGVVPGNPGTRYTDLLTQNEYLKVAGVQSLGWQLIGKSCPCPTGGGGTGVTQVYVDKAPAAPDDPTKPALSYPAGGGALSQWDVASQSWV